MNLLCFQLSYGTSPKKHVRYDIKAPTISDMDEEERKNDRGNALNKTDTFQSVDYSAFWIFLSIFLMFNSIYWCIYGYQSKLQNYKRHTLPEVELICTPRIKKNEKRNKVSFGTFCSIPSISITWNISWNEFLSCIALLLDEVWSLDELQIHHHMLNSTVLHFQ